MPFVENSSLSLDLSESEDFSYHLSELAHHTKYIHVSLQEAIYHMRKAKAAFEELKKLNKEFVCG